MTRLVIAAYTTNGRGRLYVEYMNSDSDEDAISIAIKQLEEESERPSEVMVLSGAAAVHLYPQEVWKP